MNFTYMFVHVTCEHVKHDYALVYTVDVGLPEHICTEQTEVVGMFVLTIKVQYSSFNFSTWTC